MIRFLKSFQTKFDFLTNGGDGEQTLVLFFISVDCYEVVYFVCRETVRLLLNFRLPGAVCDVTIISYQASVDVVLVPVELTEPGTLNSLPTNIIGSMLS